MNTATATEIQKPRNRRAQPKAQPEPFKGLPGMGTLLFKRALAQGATLWDGPMTLVTKDGELVQVRAEAVGTAEAGYNVKVKRPPLPEDDTSDWEHLFSFEMQSFNGSTRPQRIKTELGTIVAYPSTTREKEFCVRLQQVLGNSF